MQYYCFVSDYFYYQYGYALYLWTGKLVCRHKQKDTCSPQTLQCKSALCAQHPQPEISRTLQPYCCCDKLCAIIYDVGQKVAGCHFCLPLKTAGICGHLHRWAARREFWAPSAPVLTRLWFGKREAGTPLWGLTNNNAVPLQWVDTAVTWKSLGQIVISLQERNFVQCKGWLFRCLSGDLHIYLGR